MHDALTQAAVCGAAVGAYFGARVLVQGSLAAAERNASRMLDVERALHIAVEESAQTFVLRHQVLVRLGDFSYVWLHWPVVAGSLAFLYLRDRARYEQLRNALVVTAAIGIVLFAMFPEAPPRDVTGMTGTVSDAARRLYLGIPPSWSNQYASFPSFHVGWTLISTLTVVASLRHRARFVVFLPAVLVAVAVVTTGNHFVLDAVVGGVVSLAVWLAAGRWAAGRGRSTQPQPA